MSTEGILLAASTLKRLTLTDCEDIYRCHSLMSMSQDLLSCGHLPAAPARGASWRLHLRSSA